MIEFSTSMSGALLFVMCFTSIALGIFFGHVLTDIYDTVNEWMDKKVKGND